MKRHQTRTNTSDRGFSIPEVLVSSALLAFLVASSTQLYVNSGKTVQRGSARDAVYARIADDLEELRRETWRFACEDGTACTGNPDHSDIPVAYKTARNCAETTCTTAQVTETAGLTAACTSRTLAAYMAANHKGAGNTAVFPLTSATPTVLSWTTNLPTGTQAAPQTNGVTIERRITLNSADSNQLDVAYSTSAGSPISVSLNASLVPQALSWCP
jgi:type II secretory pathway pseudopilin PulG